MWFFDWFRKDNSMDVLHMDHFELHKRVTDSVLALCDRIKKLEEWVEGFSLFKRFDEQDKKLEELYKKVIEPVPMFQSGKSYLFSDTEEQADGIKFEGEKGIKYAVSLIEDRAKYKALLKAQHRMINRLYRLTVTSVEDPGKSITEELRKVEKWKKTLSKKFRDLKEG